MFRKMELEILQDPGNNCICENQNRIHHKGTKNTKNTKIFSSSFLCVLCAFVVGKILSLPKKCTLKSNVHFSESVSRVCTIDIFLNFLLLEIILCWLECESSTFAFQRSADTRESRTFALRHRIIYSNNNFIRVLTMSLLVSYGQSSDKNVQGKVSQACRLAGIDLSLFPRKNVPDLCCL